LISSTAMESTTSRKTMSDRSNCTNLFLGLRTFYRSGVPNEQIMKSI
jgi:hypothetical protein